LRLFNQLDKVKRFLPLRYLPLCCHAGATMPLLPVDTLVDWLSEMISHPTQDQQKCYHLVPDEKIYITEFVNQTLAHYKINMKVQRIPFPELYASILPHLNIPKQLVPYMQTKTRYSKTQIKIDYPHLKSPTLKEYLPAILDGAKGMFK